TLDAARIDWGVKHRRPAGGLAAKHWASVGGVSLVPSCWNSLTAGLGTGAVAAAPDVRPPGVDVATAAASTARRPPTASKRFIEPPSIEPIGLPRPGAYTEGNRRRGTPRAGPSSVVARRQKGGDHRGPPPLPEADWRRRGPAGRLDVRRLRAAP